MSITPQSKYAAVAGPRLCVKADALLGLLRVSNEPETQGPLALLGRLSAFDRTSPPLPLLGTASTRAGRRRDGRLGLAVPTDDHGAEPLPQ